MLKGKKILVTGATGQVARAVCAAFASDNEVWGAARFSDPEAHSRLEALGVKTFKWSLGSGDFEGLPDDFDYVFHSAATLLEVANDYDASIRENAEGTGLLMAHVCGAKAFLFVSTLIIYSDTVTNSTPRKETDAQGKHPSYCPSYSIGKVATEAVVRTLGRLYGLPVTIARLGMNYGAGCESVADYHFAAMREGRTIHAPPRGRSFISPIHNDELIAQIEPLLNAAAVPAAIVNWSGDEHADERDIIDHVAAISGLVAKVEEVEQAGVYGGAADTAKRRSITGASRYRWKESFVDVFRANYPDLPFRHPD